MIVTHSDSDHYSGIKELFHEDDITITNFVLPDIANPDEAYHELENAAVKKGCRIFYMKTGDKLKFNEVTFTCLNPEKISYDDKNRGSIVMWLKYRDFDMLLTGDMDRYAEEKILSQDYFEKGLSEVEVLKVAHHGSASASCEEFLQKINAKVAVISAGKNNRYGHPAPEVVERLSKYCKYIYLTKDSGAVTIRTDGKKFRVLQFVK